MIRLKSILKYEVNIMQKIKYEKGVTLVALVITIIVILILAGVTVNLSIDSVSSTRDRNLQSELEMIQQAIVTEYTKALELGNISETDVVPSNFIGEQITGIPTATLLDGATWYF
jgi:Tfp pilus assembly protein PilE